VVLPADYWATYEHRSETLEEFLAAVRMISAYQAVTGARFVWRGVADARWPLYSLVVRSFIERHARFPAEDELRDYERGIIEEAREWRLDWHPGGGRLAGLELLAALQHYGIPTRMMDFTFSPLIALWFAVEKNDRVDGRVFAIDISTRLVSRDLASSPDPWWFDEDAGTTSPWSTESRIWRPPPFEPRMVRQEGCFLMGGVPSTVPPRNVNVGGRWRLLRTDEIRSCMSLPFRLIAYKHAENAFRGVKTLGGGKPSVRSFTLRIGRKRVLREELHRALGISHSSLFPDFPGLAQYGEMFERIPTAP
jgi:hypothetical protein